MLHNVLAIQNQHPRDRHIQFHEEGHRYTIDIDPNSTYTSVTTWLHACFSEFDADKVIENMMKSKGWKEGHKYWNQTPEQIKELWEANRVSAASAGTAMHFAIECFMNNPSIEPSYTHQQLLLSAAPAAATGPERIHSLEWTYFLEFVRDHPQLKPYRTEWLIFDEDVKIAGSIDMVYENPDGTLSIYDWKRAKEIAKATFHSFNKFATHPLLCHLPDTNYWHYALQLNTYKTILESKYNKRVKELWLVRLHPEAKEETYELIPLPDLTRDIQDMFDERLEQVGLTTAESVTATKVKK